MLRRQALCTLATALTASPLLASPLKAANPAAISLQPRPLQPGLLQRRIEQCLRILLQQPAAIRTTATCTETIALLQHTRHTIVTGQQGSAACWQASCDAVDRCVAILPAQSMVTAPLLRLHSLLLNTCNDCLSTTVSG